MQNLKNFDFGWRGNDKWKMKGKGVLLGNLQKCLYFIIIVGTC